MTCSFHSEISSVVKVMAAALGGGAATLSNRVFLF